jgi:hypothetical protein
MSSKDKIQTNNLPKTDKIQTNNLPKTDKIQRKRYCLPLTQIGH